MDAIDLILYLGIGVGAIGFAAAFIAYKLGYMDNTSHTHQPE